MKNLFTLKSLLLLAFFTIHCTPTKNLSEEKLDVSKTIDKYIEQIEKGKSVSKNTTSLAELLSAQSNAFNLKIDSLEKSEALNDLETIYSLSDNFGHYYEKAESYIAANPLSAQLKKDADNFSKLKSTTQQDLQEKFLKKANELLAKFEETPSRTIAQQGYEHFTKAQKYGAENEATSKALDKLYVSAYQIIKVNSTAPSNKSYIPLIDDQLIELKNLNRQFTVFKYNSNDTQSADCEVMIKFMPLMFSTDEQRDAQNFQKNIQTGTETKTNSDGSTYDVPIYATVRGNVEIKTETKNASWDIEISVKQLTDDCTCKNRNFRETFQSKGQTFRTSGDDRAIPMEYKSAAGTTALRDIEMAEELLARLYVRLTSEYF